MTKPTPILCGVMAVGGPMHGEGLHAPAQGELLAVTGLLAVFAGVGLWMFRRWGSGAPEPVGGDAPVTVDVGKPALV